MLKSRIEFEEYESFRSQAFDFLLNLLNLLQVAYKFIRSMVA